MVVGLCSADRTLLADVVFVIEATATNGAYLADIKTNYVIPTLEFFNQGTIDDSAVTSGNCNLLYGIVTYQAADCLPSLTTDTFGPFSSPSKVLSVIDRLELVGGKGECNANVAEGLATAICCFEELQLKRDPNNIVQKHCILICNSAPYLMPVFECQLYSGKNVEQLAFILQDKNISLSIISPRKVPSLYKLFEKAGGDLNSCQTKNYAKDPRHLVLLRGFSLKERPVSPLQGAVSTQGQMLANTMPMTSMPSPLHGNDSPIHSVQNPMGGNSPTVVQSGMGQSPYRSPNHPQVARIVSNSQMGSMGGMPGMPAPSGYMAPSGVRPGWQMAPPAQQPRAYMQQVNSGQQPMNTTPGGSALIAQLNQPPSMTAANVNVNQFNQMNTNNSPINKILNQQPNMQTPMVQNQNIPTSIPQASQNNPVPTSQPQPTQQQPPQQIQQIKERQTIWHGVLEWMEKPKNPSEPKITKHVPCQVSSAYKDGEPEVKADGWPQKLLMQLMPKSIFGNIGGAYLKNCKSIIFHPSPCEALDSLTNYMNGGYAGCVHFTGVPAHSSCELKVMILLYIPDKKHYLGFIPNDQNSFVDKLKRVIQAQKTGHMRQTSAQMGMGTGNQQLAGNNPIQPQQSNQQPGMIISQTNALTMAGGNSQGVGQPSSNIGPPVTSMGQQGQAMGQQGQAMGQSGQSLNQPGSSINQGNQNVGNAMSQVNQQSNALGQSMMSQNANQQPPNQATNNMQPGMMGGQRAPFENQLQVERQQNLEKINKLRQTLEAAQQQEQQYKTQLERISHMKTSHLQEALQLAQHTEMQYKIMEQRMAAQGNPQLPQANNPQQPRMVRPVMGNNPGLRHLLQQQPQYRQIMNMQMGNNGRGPMGPQQMQNQGGQSNQFDDVSNFDFNMM